MRIKKFIRLLVLMLFIIMASIIPLPIKFHKKDNEPPFKIEQIDDRNDDENNEENYEVFS